MPRPAMGRLAWNLASSGNSPRAWEEAFLESSGVCLKLSAVS